MSANASNVFHNMDAMYRHQRYIYDATRKFYLIGRDRLLDRMTIAAGDAVAEIGCGTGRNLEILARRYPNSHFYGLDASAAMLITARAKMSAARLKNVELRTALAENYDHASTFGLERPFDVIFFSYSISMIPVWREAIANALANLRPGGTLYIVDFYDQEDLPGWFRSMLKGWLRRFHVQFWNDLMPFLHKLESDGRIALIVEPVARRYAFLASLQKPLTY